VSLNFILEFLNNYDSNLLYHYEKVKNFAYLVYLENLRLFKLIDRVNSH